MNVLLTGIIGLITCGDKETDTSSSIIETIDVVDTREETLVDVDNDGVLAEYDCDDDFDSTIVLEDCDCDGIIIADDCELGGNHLASLYSYCEGESLVASSATSGRVLEAIAFRYTAVLFLNPVV